MHGDFNTCEAAKAPNRVSGFDQGVHSAESHSPAVKMAGCLMSRRASLGNVLESASEMLLGETRLDISWVLSHETDRRFDVVSLPTSRSFLRSIRH